MILKQKLATTIGQKSVIRSTLLTLGIREIIFKFILGRIQLYWKIVGQVYQHQHKQYPTKSDKNIY